jgi:hypothetical protein
MSRLVTGIVLREKAATGSTPGAASAQTGGVNE